MSKGSTITIGYRFGMGLHMGLCTGPVDEISCITAGGKILYSSAITSSTTIQLNQPGLFGGDTKEGGIVGQLDVMMGEPTQQRNAYLQSQLGLPMPAFRGLVTMVFNGEVGAMSPYVKPWGFQVQRYVAGWRTPVWQPSLCQVGSGMNGAHVIYRAITDPVTGLGEPDSTLDLTKLLAAAQTLQTENMGLCLKWSRSDVLSNFLDTVCAHVGGIFVDDSTTGLKYLKLLRADYDITQAPVVNESNIVELSSYEPAALAGSVNQVTVTYHDCQTNRDANVTVQNPVNIQAQGRVVSQTNTYPGLWNFDQAAKVAMRDLHALSALPSRVKIKVQNTLQVIRGDVLAFSWAALNVSQMPLRVLEIDRGTATAGTITLTCAQDVYSMPSATYVVQQPPLWTTPNTTPEPVPEQQLVEASYRDLVANLSAADLAQVGAPDGYVAALAARPTSLAYNYDLWTRPGTSGNFVKVGTGDFTATATLATAMVAEAGPSPVTLSAMSDIDQVSVGAAVLVDAEVMRITAVNASAGTMTLARGCVDTTPVPHAAGARLWVTDHYAGHDRTTYLNGETVQGQLLTRTSTAVLDPSLAPVASVTMAERQIRPYPPALSVNGSLFPTSVTAPVTCGLARRNRLTQADQLIDVTSADITPESGQTCTVTFLQGATQLAQQTGIAGTSAAAWSPAHTGTYTIQALAVRDGYTSCQASQWTGNVVVPITVTASLPAGTVGSAYSGSVSATGGAPGGYTWTVSPALPSGLSLNAATGAITGTISASGYNVSAEPFLTATGGETSAPLTIGGVPVAGSPAVTAIHSTDWQGRQLLSTAPRTNYAKGTSIINQWPSMGGGSGGVLTDSGISPGVGAPNFVKCTHNLTNGFSVLTYPAPGNVGDTISFQLRLRGGTGVGATVALVGIYSGTWGAQGCSTAQVVSGPGTILAYNGTIALWYVRNLSPTTDTVVCVTRVVASGETSFNGAYFPQNSGSGSAGAAAVGDYGLVAAPCLTVNAPPAPYIHAEASSTLVTVTDYALSGSAVSFGQAAAAGAFYDWDGIGTPKTMNFIFSASDTGVQSASTLATLTVS